MNHHLRKKARLTSFLRKALKPLCVVCALAPVFGLHTASAQSLFWQEPGGGSGNWDHDPANPNWSTTAAAPASIPWTDNNTAVFGGTAGGTVTLDDFGAPIIVTGLHFTTTGYTITDGGVSGGLFPPNLQFAGGTSTITVDSTLTATIDTGIVNTNTNDSLIIDGGGKLILSGLNTATYFGGAGTGSITIVGGTTVQAAAGTGNNGNNAIPSSSHIVIANGTLDLNGTAQQIATLATPTTASTPGAIVTNTSATASVLTIGANSLDPSSTFGGKITDNDTTAISTSTTAAAGSLGITITTPTGVGAPGNYTLILTGAGLNDYHGLTTIGVDTGNTATLQAGAANVFSPNSAVDIRATGTLDINGFAQTVAGLDGTGTGTVTNTLQNTTAILTLGGGTGAAALTAGTTLTSAAKLVDTGTGVLGLTKSGAYKQVLSGANTYSGATTVSGGILASGSSGGFSSNSAYTVTSPGILDLNGFSSSIGSLQGNGTVENSTGTATLSTGSDNTSTTFSGLIQNGGGTLALTKTGAGIFTLTDTANSYTGGTNIVNGTVSFVAGALGTTGTIDFVGNSPAFTNTTTLQYQTGNVTDISSRLKVEDGATATIDTNGNAETFTSGLQTGVAGTGGLTKTGLGTLTLTGANTYSGTTTVNNGTLQAGAAAGFSATSAFRVTAPGILDINGFAPTIGSLAGNGTVTNTNATAGTLTTGNDNTNKSFTGTIQDGAGTVALSKIGTGIQTLGGTSTYTGATAVTAGTLRAGSNTGFSAASTLTVTTPGIVDVNGFTPTVASLAGSGTVTNNAAGTTGSLTTGGNNTSTAFTGSLQDGAGLLGLNKVGTGTLTVSLSSYSGATNISAGTLKAATTTAFSQNSSFNITGPGIVDLNGFSNSVGSLAGTGTVTNGGTAAATITAGQNGASTTFSGLIKDGKAPVAFVKTGSGTMTLTSANTFTGGAMLQGGALVIANSQALGGGNVAVNGGNLQLGGSNNNIQVNGNYQQTGGELDLRIGGTAPGTFDRLTVAGNAALGGRLNVSSVNNYAPKNGDTITIITAGGGVTGTFQQVAGTLSNFPLVKLTVDYQPGQVVLEFSQGSFMEAAVMLHLDLTPNQKAVASALDHISSNSKATRLLNALDSTGFFSLPRAYDLIAPEEYGTIFEISRSGAKMEATTIENRLDEVHATANPTAAAGPAGPVDDKGSKEIMPPPEYRLGVFANGSGEFVKVGDSTNAAGYNFNSGGVTVGVDYRFTEHFVAGVLFNYTRASADLVDNGRLDADAFRGGVYASLFGGGAYVNGFLGGAYNDYDVRRAGFGGSVRGNTNGGDFNALITTGYDLHAGGLTYGPVASFQYTYTGLSSFDETGSLDPLHVNSTKGESMLTNVGLRATYDWHIGSMVLVPEVRATWQHEYGDTFEETSSSMLLGSPAFTVTSSPIGRDSLILNAGFTLRITPQLSAYAFYDGELARTNYQANNVLVGVRSSF